MIVWCIFILMCLFVLLLVLAYIKFASLTKRIKKNWQTLDSLLRYRTQYIAALSLYGGTLPQESHVHLEQLNTVHTHATPSLPLDKRALYEAQISAAFTKILDELSKQNQLKADPAFQKLRDNILHAQAKIQRAQTRYNSSAREFNMISSIIPLNLITAMFEMAPAEYFELPIPSDIKK